MSYTEFCCRSGGSNLNAGTRTGSTTEPGTSADLTYSSGSWVNGTRVFTVASGDPVADGVAVGDFAAIDTGGATAAFIARVTARTATTITLNSTGAGTNPANGTYTLRIGGAWAGPSGTTAFPFSIAVSSLTNASNHIPAVNFKNAATYSVTSAMTLSIGGRAVWRGYNTTYGDGGKALISGGTSGASYIVLTVSGGLHEFQDLCFANNGATGSSTLVSVSGTRCAWDHCAFSNCRGSGISMDVAGIISECECYDWNQSNTADTPGFLGRSAALFRCIAHDGKRQGFITYNAVECIADNCTGAGFWHANSNVAQYMQRCVAYKCVTGLSIEGNGNRITVENCIFDQNTGYGINNSGSTNYVMSRNNGFYGNSSGQTSGVTLNGVEIGNLTLASSPFVDADNGDFRINLAAAQASGRGSFTQLASGYAGTVSYPDIGAAQSAAGGGSTLIVIED